MDLVGDRIHTSRKGQQRAIYENSPHGRTGLDSMTVFNVKICFGGIAIIVAIYDKLSSNTTESFTRYIGHKHAGYELHYMQKNCSMLINDQLVEMNTGDCLIIPPHISHRMANHCETIERTKFLYNVYADNRSQLSDAQIASQLIQIEGYSVIHDGMGELYDIIQHIKKEFAGRGLFCYERMQALFMNLFILLARKLKPCMDCSAERFPINIDEYRMQQIEDFFELNFSRNVTASTLANSLYISVRQLNRLLRKLYNLPFRDILFRTRMEKARYYVEHTDMALTAIPNLVGYGSVNALYLAYKKCFGATLKETRNNRGSTST